MICPFPVDPESFPLGMKDGIIQDCQLTSSSEWNPNHSAINARLDRPHGNGKAGAWCAKTNDVNQWIQVDFGEMKLVSGIVMQGRTDYEQWVKKYKVQYSNDGISWQFVTDHNQRSDKVSFQYLVTMVTLAASYSVYQDISVML